MVKFLIFILVQVLIQQTTFSQTEYDNRPTFAESTGSAETASKVPRHGEFPCGRAAQGVRIQAAFKAKGFIYLFTGSNDGSFLVKLRYPIRNNWFCVADHYPKKLEHWSEEDFPGSQLRTSPNGAFAYGDRLYLLDGQNLVEFQIDGADEGRSTFRYVNRLSLSKMGLENKANEDTCEDQLSEVLLQSRNFLKLSHKTYPCSKQGSQEMVWFELVEHNVTKVKTEPYISNGQLGEASAEFTLVDLGNTSFGVQNSGYLSIPVTYQNVDNLTTIPLIWSSEKGVSFNLHFPSGTAQEYRLIVPNMLWFACPVDKSCLRFYVDDGDKINESSVLLFVGRYVFRIRSMHAFLDNGILIDQYFKLEIPYYVDAVFVDRHNQTVFIVKDKTVWIVEPRPYGWKLLVKKNVKSIFEGDAQIESGLVTSKDFKQLVHLFQGNGQVTQYSITYNSTVPSSSRLASKAITEINSNLPARIDAVFTDPESGTIFVIRNNYILNISSESFWNQQSTSSFMSIFSYFGCQNKTLDPLNITDADREVYFNISLPLPEKVKVGARMRPVIQEVQKMWKNNDYYIVYIVYSLIAVLAVAHIAAILVAYQRFTRPEETDRHRRDITCSHEISEQSSHGE